METIQYSEDARHYISLIHNTINRMAGKKPDLRLWMECEINENGLKS